LALTRSAAAANANAVASAMRLRGFGFISGSTSSAACSACSTGTYSAAGQRTCSSCEPGTYAKRTGATSCSIVLQIFQFKAPYLVSEVTVDIQGRMSRAVANVLGVDAIDVVLTFVPSTLDRRSGQTTGVLVNAGVTDLELSAASLSSKVTQDKLNKEMAAVGLSSGQLVSATGMSHCEETTSIQNFLLFVMMFATSPRT
jgi:hypothetical protein